MIFYVIYSLRKTLKKPKVQESNKDGLRHEYSRRWLSKTVFKSIFMNYYFSRMYDQKHSNCVQDAVQDFC